MSETSQVATLEEYTFTAFCIEIFWLALSLAVPPLFSFYASRWALESRTLNQIKGEFSLIVIVSASIAGLWMFRRSKVGLWTLRSSNARKYRAEKKKGIKIAEVVYFVFIWMLCGLFYAAPRMMMW